MSQIISIHVGGSGTKVGLKFWQELTSLMYEEKKELKNQYYNKFYHESTKIEESIPRAVFIDTDIRSINLVKKSKLNFNEKLMFGEGSSSENLFSEGMYLSGAQLKDKFSNSIRKQTQKCDKLSGFMMTSSPAGGIGSGLGTNILQVLREYYCGTIVQNFPILPGFEPDFKFRNLDPLQIYNMIASTHYAIQTTDIEYVFENKAMERILFHRGNVHPNYDQINQYMGHCLNEHIFPYLSSGQLNLNPRKRAVNLAVYPRMKFICGSLNSPNPKNVLESSLMAKNKVMDHQIKQNKFLFSMNVNVRDRWISENQVYKIVKEWSNDTDNKFLEWIPNSIHLFLGNQNAARRKSSWVLSNDVSNINWIQKTCQVFTALFRRKAFLHHYTSDGMDEMQFVQAESNCNDIVSEYLQYAPYDLDDEEQYEQYNDQEN